MHMLSSRAQLSIWRGKQLMSHLSCYLASRCRQLLCCAVGTPTPAPAGSVTHEAAAAPSTSMPFLFDLAQFATKEYRERICGRGIDYSWKGRWHCFG